MRAGETSTTVIIIGAGPIGLMLANLLGRQKINTLVLEKEAVPPDDSRAIGLMPPSLRILKPLGLDQAFIREAVKVREAFVHGNKKPIGSVSFDSLPSEYKFILSLPQSRTQALLSENLKKYSCVRILRDKAFHSLYFHDANIEIHARDPQNGRHTRYFCEFLCACDGSKSAVRRFLGIPYRGKRYRDTFLMADFIDNSGLGAQVHLFFTPDGAVESFPLPQGQRRWIVQTSRLMPQHDTDFIRSTVQKRTGVDISSCKALGQSAFGVEHFSIKSYALRDRLFFCGDAAHSMSPVGGQGMNTGFADALLLSDLLSRVIHGGEPVTRLARLYSRNRKKAAAQAAGRAWLSMRIGTLKGKISSTLRRALILLLLRILKNRIPPYFSMLTIKNRMFNENPR